MRTLTDGGLYDHCIRIGGALAVSSSVDRLHPEHVVLSSGQAMAHKPTHSKEKLLRAACFIKLILIFFFNTIGEGRIDLINLCG